MDLAVAKEKLRMAYSRQKGGTIFGYFVMDPERFGVVSIDREGRAVDIEEKPIKPKKRLPCRIGHSSRLREDSCVGGNGA